MSALQACTHELKLRFIYISPLIIQVDHFFFFFFFQKIAIGKEEFLKRVNEYLREIY